MTERTYQITVQNFGMGNNNPSEHHNLGYLGMRQKFMWLHPANLFMIPAWHDWNSIQTSMLRQQTNGFAVGCRFYMADSCHSKNW